MWNTDIEIGRYSNVKTAGLVVLVVLFVLLLSIRWRRGLRELPGPLLASFTQLDRLRTAASGQPFRAHIEYHRRYGSLVRIGPHHVSISDAQFIPMIYGIGSKFIKANILTFANLMSC